MTSSTPASFGEVTRLLDAWSRQDKTALDRLLPLVLGELRRIARRHLASESSGHTLQPTAVVNEVYLRLVGVDARSFDNRTQFFALASRLMRDILVDHARSRLAQKRGGAHVFVDLAFVDNIAVRQDLGPETILSLDAALVRLETVDPTLTRLVELRFFSGLTMNEAAAVLEISLSTAERTWRIARRRLARELGAPRSVPSLG